MQRDHDHHSPSSEQLDKPQPTRLVTAGDFAKEAGVSTSTARRRLEEMRQKGDASILVCWEHKQSSNLSDIRRPPPTKVIKYKIQA